MPPFFMATTIKVDGSVAAFTWQDDQLLDKLADVDYCVDGNTATTPAILMVPFSTVGTGSDAAGFAAPKKKTAKG